MRRLRLAAITVLLVPAFLGVLLMLPGLVLLAAAGTLAAKLAAPLLKAPRSSLTAAVIRALES